ncbi:unnamed protein product [Rodentolepis nana]|uniref:DUF5737 domain-containing protein n=1 Tax=Rodentolepis nana TaxID=102285 RepID=A0A0R3T0F1_RODNA|nr:unnamed protein product [Rodentolepis nana]
MSGNRSAIRYNKGPPSLAYPGHSTNARGHSELRTRFEELGFNYGFARADPGKNSGYCFVYRTLKNKLEKMGAACTIQGDENEIRLTELEGPIERREKVKIFTNDIVSYYKFNHRAKFIAICIDAKQRRKTGYWFLCFEREGQLTVFCAYLNWLFGLDVQNYYEGPEEARISYVDRRSGSAQSFLLSHASRQSGSDSYFSRYEQDAYDSGYTESSSEAYSSSTMVGTPSLPPPPRKFQTPRLSPQKSPRRRIFKLW